MAETEKKGVPPYLPYKTLNNFLERFKQGVPGRIDKGLMGSMSGAMQSRLSSALRYLGLISENGIPSDVMRQLVKTEGQERKKAWAATLKAAYPFVFHDGFDFGTATLSLLKERFEQDTGATGETINLCIAFLKEAALDAGITVSPYLKEPRGTRSNTPRPRRNAANGGGGTGEAPPAKDPDVNNKSWKALLLEKFPALDPEWSDDVKAKWFDAFEKLMSRRE
jgi:hypothetical protein